PKMGFGVVFHETSRIKEAFSNTRSVFARRAKRLNCGGGVPQLGFADARIKPPILDQFFEKIRRI
ncbi:MAG: hypothetical protein LBV04_06245, partial [Deferribacteraceae bacterium]|nr:hypothetical protein [Deferribacteraceae bacterium]